MSKRVYSIIFFILLFFSGSSQLLACTEIHFKTKQAVISARTMDWPEKDFLIVIHPRGTHRQAAAGLNHEKLYSWVSQYGSVTYNVGNQTQAGQDGLNEKGLNAASLWLSKTKYPEKDSRPAITTNFWVQYILDNFKNVNEVIAGMPKIGVLLGRYQHYLVKQHVIVYDSTGNTAILEYIDGNLVIHQGHPLSVPVLTNDPYSEALTDLKNYQGFGGTRMIPKGYDSKSRFVRAAYYLKQSSAMKAKLSEVALAFRMLDAISQPSYVQQNGKREPNDYPTQWSVVKELTRKNIFFTTKDNRHIRQIKLDQINFDPHQPVRIVDIHAGCSRNMLYSSAAVSGDSGVAVGSATTGIS